MAERIDSLTAVFTAPDRVCIDPTALEHACPLDNHLRLPPQQPPARQDRLSRLPVEMLHNIWSHLDLAALTATRRASRHLRATVTSQKQYTDVLEHAPQLIRAALSTHAGGGVSLRRVHALVFREPACEGRPGCPHFGLLVHLPTFVRVCYDCLCGEPRFFTPTVRALKWRFLMDLEGVPVLNAVPGRYGPPAIWTDRVEAVNLSVLNRVREGRGEHAIRSDWIGQYDWPAASLDTEAMMFALRVPYVDLAVGKEHLPRVCRGCFRMDRLSKGVHHVATFTEEDYDLHIDQCPETRARLRRLELGKGVDDSYFEERFTSRFGRIPA